MYAGLFLRLEYERCSRGTRHINSNLNVASQVNKNICGQLLEFFIISGQQKKNNRFYSLSAGESFEKTCKCTFAAKFRIETVNILSSFHHLIYDVMFPSCNDGVKKLFEKALGLWRRWCWDVLLNFYFLKSWQWDWYRLEGILEKVDGLKIRNMFLL